MACRLVSRCRRSKGKKGERMNINPGDLYRATEETGFGHSHPTGSVTLILSHEGEMFEDSKLWYCTVMTGTTGFKKGFEALEKVTEKDMERFERVGNLYDMLSYENQPHLPPKGGNIAIKKPKAPALYLEVVAWPGADIGDAINEALFIVSTLNIAVRISWTGAEGIPVWPGDDHQAVFERWERLVFQEV